MTKDLTRKLYKDRKKICGHTAAAQKGGATESERNVVRKPCKEHLNLSAMVMRVGGLVTPLLPKLAGESIPSPSPYSLTSKKWAWLHAPYTDFSCAGKKRGEAGGIQTPAKASENKTRNNRGNPRHSPRLLCERKYAIGRSERHRRNKGSRGKEGKRQRPQVKTKEREPQWLRTNTAETKRTEPKEKNENDPGT